MKNEKCERSGGFLMIYQQEKKGEIDLRSIWMPLCLLLSFSTLLLLYQWSIVDFSNQQEKETSQQESIPLHVTVNVEEAGLEIVLTYDQLEPGIYKLDPPEEAESLSCAYEGETECHIVQSGGYQLNQESAMPVKVDYFLPIDTQGLLKEWKLNVSKDGKAQKVPYDLTIKDYTLQRNTWLAPLKKNSEVTLENVRYFHFGPTTETPPLMLQPKENSQWRQDRSVVTYNKEDPLTDEMKERLAKISSAYGPAILHLDHSNTVLEDQYIASKGRNLDALEKALFTSHVRSISNDDQEWILPVLNEVYYQTADPEPKVSMRAEEIRSTFSGEQLDVLRNKLIDETGNVDIEQFLDEEMSGLYGMPTTYFQRNDQNSTAPLYFTSEEILAFEGEKLEGKILHYHGVRYLPVLSLAEKAEYSYTVLEEADVYRISMPTKSYRFYVDQATFIINEESFGTGKDLLKLMDGEVYMKEEYIEDLLDLEVVEEDEVISVHKK
ncbi:hypothetical protein HLI_02310 [Halobacillus litoralis]|uniref:Copper amine oxidase-like N-terminal domain-containing protein n=2 Tax=Halobacillus litoralis TaxID=45668 RepID=A0A410M8U9_9BACI|nr:hypothetical protein HLI_02310 [Halobacillus litoralis]